MSTVSQELDNLSEQIRKHRWILEEGMEGARGILTGRSSKQWYLELQDDPGSIVNYNSPLIIPVWELPPKNCIVTRWNVDASYEFRVGDVFPPPAHGSKAATITAARLEDYPPAKEARDKYEQNTTWIEGVYDANARDINDLINFPRALGRFYDEWNQVANSIATLDSKIGGVVDVDKRVEWSGSGADAYRDAVKNHVDAALATQFGAKVIRENVIEIAKMAVELCKLLTGIVEKVAADVKVFWEALKTLMNPMDWKGKVDWIVGAVNDSMKNSVDAFKSGVDQIMMAAEKKLALDSAEIDLKNKLGTDDYTWPNTVVSGGWRGNEA